MKSWIRFALLGVGVAALTFSLASAGDDDEKSPDSTAGALALLSDRQQQAVGIVVGRPVAALAPDHIDALGVVLDATLLQSDLGESAAAAAAEHSASAEMLRLRALFDGGAGASRKMLEAAQAEHAKTQAEAELTAARLSLHWAPLLALAPESRQQIIATVMSGRGLLVRADLPGRHSIGSLPAKALLDVDGVQVAGRVLGMLRQTNESQSVALLIEIQRGPTGLAAGARVPISLLTAQRPGMLLPRDAVLYDENGAYVYKQRAGQADGKLLYAPVRVKLLMSYGQGWLVDGVDADDDIVIRGAGVLWSLQGVGTPAPDDD
ncbi:MAG TPA: hypothetical protein VGI90_01420 [Steroidobacteraceae bacterium]|jgi:hypothetical protein